MFSNMGAGRGQGPCLASRLESDTGVEGGSGEIIVRDIQEQLRVAG
jgi:hypothetical protein